MCGWAGYASIGEQAERRPARLPAVPAEGAGPQGWRQREIATALGVSAGTVSQRLKRPREGGAEPRFRSLTSRPSRAPAHLRHRRYVLEAYIKHAGYPVEQLMRRSVTRGQWSLQLTLGQSPEQDGKAHNVTSTCDPDGFPATGWTRF